MKHLPSLLAAAALAATLTSAALAAPLDQHTLDKRTGSVLGALNLTDTAKADAVRAMLEPHFQALQAWHETNDPAIADLWKQWSAARVPDAKDEAKAAAIAKQIEGVYATFRPQHDALLARLGTVLTPEQVEGVKDALTKSPGMMRTYNAYLAMIPEFTDAQKAFILGKLRAAREVAMDAMTDKEKASLFKTYKVQIEAYIDEQGYDYRARYKAWAEAAKAQR